MFRTRKRKIISTAIAVAVIAALVIGITQLWLVPPAKATISATLSILSGEVSVLHADSTDWVEGSDNMTLDMGAKVRTGTDSYALLTFFDGSTIEIEPETEISIVELDSSASGSTTVQMKQWFGRSWSRVENLVDTNSSYTVESMSSVAAARGTLFNIEVAPDGTSFTQTYAGNVGYGGLTQEEGSLPAGKESWINMGKSTSPTRSIAPPISRLIVSIDSPAWLQVIDPVGRSAGIVPPGINVNQIPDSTTSGRLGKRQTVALNSPRSGEHEIILYAKENGTISLAAMGISNDKLVAQETHTLQVKMGKNYRLPLQLTMEKKLITSLELGEMESFTETRAGEIVITRTVTEDDLTLDADFIAEDDMVIAGQTIQFTNLSAGDIDLWEWDFGDGATSSDQNPTHSYTSAGTYPVSLTVSNGSEGSKETKYVMVYSDPTTDFTAAVTQAYVGQAVWFDNNSSGNPSEGLWDFGDGTTSDEKYPYHRYTEPGTYTVSLTVSNPAGTDKLTKADYITVSAVPWPMFRHDAKHTGRSDHQGPQSLSSKWKFSSGSFFYQSSPAASPDGLIYVGAYNGNLYAVKPDGSVLWSYTTGGKVESSPAVAADGIVYFGSEDGKVYALYPSGVQKWSYQTDGAVRSSPVVADNGTVYFGSDDGYLYALNQKGTLKWRYATGDHIHWSSPAIADDGTVYVGSSDSSLYAVNPDGTLKGKCTTGDAILSSPAIADDGTVYIGSNDGKLYAFDPGALSTPKWSYSTGVSIYAAPTIASDGTVYVGSIDGKLHCINPDGALKWSFTTGDSVRVGAAVDSNGVVYVGSGDKNLYALNPDGSVKATFSAGEAIHCAPTIGANGTIYVACYEGSLYALG